jgi:hypothetical protein
MSQIVLVSDTLLASPSTGTLEYNGQFYGTDSNSARAQMQRITQGTAVASTSGTAIDFTSLPAWVKRITVMFTGVSPAAAVNYIVVQLGTGATPTYTTSGYNSQIITGNTSSVAVTLVSNGFPAINPLSAANASSGTMVLTNVTGNTWSMTNSCADTSGTRMYVSAGSIALGATLTAVRITTADAFDAGSINILYEG